MKYNAYICLREIAETKTEKYLIEADVEELIKNLIESSNKLNNNVQLCFIKERKQIPENLEITKRRSVGALKDDVSPYLDEIKKYLAEDMEMKEISRRLKVNYSSLYNYIKTEHLRKPKVRPRPKRPKKDWSKITIRKSKMDPYRDLIVEELKNGKTAVDIASNNGWKYSTLHYYICRHELRKR